MLCPLRIWKCRRLRMTAVTGASPPAPLRPEAAFARTGAKVTFR